MKGPRILALAACVPLVSATAAFGQDLVAALSEGTRVRIHAGQVREIPGVVTVGAKSVVTKGAVVVHDNRLIAVKIPDQEVPFCLPRPGATLTGRLVAMSDEAWTIVVDGHPAPFRLPRNVVGAIDVSRGRSSSAKRMLKGAGIGLLLGAAGGAAFGEATGSDCSPHSVDCWFSRSDTAALGAIGIGALGAVVGGIVGALPAEQWQRMPTSGRHVSLGLHHGRGVEVSVAFGF
jgi:hypothetical protein